MKPRYTQKQGQYLAFIYYYTKLNWQAPAYADFEKYFRAEPSSVNSMIKTLESKGFISKERRKARSIKLLLSKEELPELE